MEKDAGREQKGLEVKKLVLTDLDEQAAKRKSMKLDQAESYE